MRYKRRWREWASSSFRYVPSMVTQHCLPAVSLFGFFLSLVDALLLPPCCYYYNLFSLSDLGILITLRALPTA